MWVAQSDVDEVIHWFHRQSSAQFLALFVAGSNDFDVLLRKVIANRQVLDTIIGPYVDLVLFSDADFSGEPGSGPQIRHISNLKKWSPRLTGDIVSATAMSTHDIASNLGLSISDLPGLVLLRRRHPRSRWEDENDQKLVLSLRGATDVEFLVEFLRAFRKSLERIAAARRIGFAFGRDPFAVIEQNVSSRLQELEVIQTRIAFVERISKDLTQGRPEAELRTRRAIDLIKGPSFSEDVVEKMSAAFDVDRKTLEGMLSSRARQRLNKTTAALQNARKRVRNLEKALPLEAALAIAIANEEELTELQSVLDRFDRKLSYRLMRDRIFRFLHVSGHALDKMRKIIQAIASIKTGGASIL